MLLIDTGNIRSLSVNPSETLIAIGFSSGLISIVDSRTGMMVGSLRGGDGDIIHVGYSAFNS